MSRDDDLGGILDGIRAAETERLSWHEEQRREDATRAGYPQPPPRRVVSRRGQ